MADPAFQPDSEIAEIAAAYSQDAIELAARNFGVSLDESEASICDVEKMLGRLHNDLANARASEKQVMVIAKAFGSYVGEVLRRHHGAE